MLKIAVPVYNPKDSLERSVQDAYHANCHRFLSAIEIKSFIESIVAYEGLFEQFLSYPNQVAGNIFSSDNESVLVHVPCYTLELRQILKNKKIVSPYKIAGLTQQSAKEYLTEYPVILVLDSEMIECEDRLTMQGISVFDNTIDISKALIRVLVQERGDSDCAAAIENIVAEEFPNATVHMLTEPPGLAFPKVAAVVAPDLHKYIVNIKSLNINHEVVKSHSPEDAVQKALDRVWHETGNPHKDPQYTVDSWRNTEYWPMIVKKAAFSDPLPFMLPPVKAATWYEDMKNRGEGEPEADWICGNVIRSNFLTGAIDETNILVFDTGVERFKLAGDEDRLKELEKLVDKSICAKGIKKGYFFDISDYRINDGKRPDDMIYMRRSNTEDMLPFSVGDKVRQRKRDLAFPQLYGKVVKIEDGLMYVEWSGVKDKEVFKLSNPANIYLKIEKL